MKEQCETEVDPISMEDWCDINPNNYIMRGVLNERQCFNTTSLITWMETCLVEDRNITNPMNRDILTGDQVMYVCAQHVNNGSELPPRLHQHVEVLLRQADAADNRRDRILALCINSLEFDQDTAAPVADIINAYGNDVESINEYLLFLTGFGEAAIRPVSQLFADIPADALVTPVNRRQIVLRIISTLIIYEDQVAAEEDARAINALGNDAEAIITYITGPDDDEAIVRRLSHLFANIPLQVQAAPVQAAPVQVPANRRDRILAPWLL
jgi:hypothetical protein